MYKKGLIAICRNNLRRNERQDKSIGNFSEVKKQFSQKKRIQNEKRPIFLKIREKWAFDGHEELNFSHILRKTGRQAGSFSQNVRKKVWVF